MIINYNSRDFLTVKLAKHDSRGVIYNCRVLYNIATVVDRKTNSLIVIYNFRDFLTVKLAKL